MFVVLKIIFLYNVKNFVNILKTVLGSICVALSYPFIFGNIFQSYNPSAKAKFIFYAPLVAIFQFGWASCQISHLSMIPVLTDINSYRDELNACRYIFTVLSNIAVYCLIWILLGNDKESALTPSDQKVFTVNNILKV